VRGNGLRYRNQSAKAETLAEPVGNRVGIGRGPGANRKEGGVPNVVRREKDSKRVVGRNSLMMEAARTSETLVNLYQTTRHYNPEDSRLRTHRRENVTDGSVYILGYTTYQSPCPANYLEY
jgi:hypothetical protein